MGGVLNKELTSIMKTPSEKPDVIPSKLWREGNVFKFIDVIISLPLGKYIHDTYSFFAIKLIKATVANLNVFRCSYAMLSFLTLNVRLHVEHV